METSALVAVLSLLGLIVLCLLSRMCAGRTKLGAQATATVQKAVDRLKKEAAILQSASHQDDLPILALVHNSEALAAVRAARALVQEHGLMSEDLLDLTVQLQEEQDMILAAVAQDMDNGSHDDVPPPAAEPARLHRLRPA